MKKVNTKEQMVPIATAIIITRFYPQKAFIILAIFMACFLLSPASHAQQLELYSGSATATNGPATSSQTATLYQNSGTSSTFTAFSPTTTATISFSNQAYTSSTYPGLTFGSDSKANDVTTLSATGNFNIMNNIGSPLSGMFTSAADVTTSGTNFDITQNYGFRISTDAYYQFGNSLTARNYYGDITITFNRAVVNPVIHFSGMGGYFQAIASGPVQGFYTELEMSSTDVAAGRTLTLLSGVHSALDATNTKILNTNASKSTTTANYGSDQQYAGAGSVMINTTPAGITSITFRVYLKGDGGTSAGAVWATLPSTTGRPVDGWMLSVSLGTYTISGNIYNDTDGLSDNTVDGTGTNGGGLNAVLVNNSNTVLAYTAVSSSGVYSFRGVPEGGNYSVLITSLTPTIGSTAPAISLPSGYLSTGENIGSGTGSDGTPDSKLSLGVISANVSNANFGIGLAGYMYVHKKTLDESSSTSFTFSVSGGPTTVSNFSLNDNPAYIPVKDIGASQNGRLWAIGTSNNTIYYKDLGASSWTATSITNASRIDGGATNTCYYVSTGGSVFSFDGTTNTSLGGSGVSDIGSTWDNRPYIINTSGQIWRYAGSGTTWAQVGSSNSNSKIDGNPATGNIIVARSASVVSITSTGAETSLGIPSGFAAGPYDIGIDAAGNIYGLFARQSVYNGSWGIYPYKWVSGTTWSEEYTARNSTGYGTSSSLTGTIGNQVWMIYDAGSSTYGTIYSRATDGTNVNWIDNDWVRTTTANTEMIAVAPGTYTLTETLPGGWDLSKITLNDPSGNSSGTVATQVTTLNVASGETVHAEYQNNLVSGATIGSACGVNTMQNFGSGTTIVGGALVGQTSYHYSTSSHFEDGYYSLVKTGSGWDNSSLTDHSNITNGYFLAVNASYGLDEFYRKRVTGLIPGATYTLSFWAADLSQNSILRPNVTLGLADISTGASLGSVNTGNITSTAWKQYSFTFTPNTTSADLFLRNNGQGGDGNDLAIDDIAFNLSAVISPTTTVSYASCPSSGGIITVTSPTGSNIEYSIDGTAYQTSPTFSSLSPGIYTVHARYAYSTCDSTKKDTIRPSICGNVYDDANGLKDIPTGIVSGSGTDGNGIKVVLYDSTSLKVAGVVTVPSTGIYRFTDLSVGNKYTLFLTTTSVTVGQVATPSLLPSSGWAYVGEYLGSGAGNDGNVNGTLSLGTASTHINNANFGIDQLPSASDITYIISPVPTRGSTHALTNAYRNMLPLNYYDPEDCSTNCPTNFGVIIQAYNSMNGNVLSYNGIPITPPYTIANYKPDSLTVTFNQLGVSSFSFYYKLIDAAGVQSIDPNYTVSWGSSVLAVNLLDFTAAIQGNKALLQWSTVSGSGSDRFVLQRSADGIGWSTLTSVAGIANTSKQHYNYTDNAPLTGNNYYRLAQTDKDGNTVYSKTKLLRFGEAWKVSLQPNPLLTGNNLKLLSNQKVRTIRITDLQGKVLWVASASQGNGVYELKAANISNGVYIISAINENDEMQTLRMIKMK